MRDSTSLSRGDDARMVAACRARAEFAVFRRSSILISDAVGDEPFTLDPAGRILLYHRVFQRPELLGFHLRHALEFAWLRRHSAASAAMAGLAAARAAALFIEGETRLLGPQARAALPSWTAPMANEVAPSRERLAAISADLPGGRASLAEIDHIRAIWQLLGTAEAVMETGGDIRLQLDPQSALNGYGCSHRPRPWAITFASSTASSSSERGYVAADRERLKRSAGLLTQAAEPEIRACLAAVRQSLAQIYSLAPGAAVTLAASGTDTELLALALSHLASPGHPILNILIAPEETGRGVPMAARGLHFAVDIALGHAVSHQAAIDGSGRIPSLQPCRSGTPPANRTRWRGSRQSWRH